MNRAGWITVAVLHGVLLFGAGFAPYAYDEQHRTYSYAPPSLSVRGPEGCRVEWLRSGRLFTASAPCGVFVLGTDAYGRDVLSRVLFGGRISLLAGLLATLLALVLGTAAGTVAGYFGRWPDRVLMRGGELMMALPWLYLLLAVRAVLPLHLGPFAGFVLVVGTVGCLGWVRPSRLVRSLVLSVRERGYVQAALGFGGTSWYVIHRHVLPEVRGLVITQATVLLPQFLLAEVTLSFLGLGIGEPLPSWGNMLAEARQYFALVSHPWLLAPGILLVPLLFVYFTVADRLVGEGT